MSKNAVLVGEKIRLLRQQRALSQESLALKSGLNTSYLGQVERGEKSPTIDTLDKIATGLDVDLEQLFTFDKKTEPMIDLSFLEKIVYELNGRTEQEQEVVYDFIKRLLRFRDKK